MERYGPLLTISLAFIAAVWSYGYYSNCQYVRAEEEAIISQIEESVQPCVIRVKAQHILVKTFDEAKKIREKIIQGESFEKLAQQLSLCPSGKQGGSLGYIERGRMIPDFEKAAFALGEGELSMPVETQFGWHLIKVTDVVSE